MKKIITILLTLLMVASLGTVVFAENEATLTITGAPDGGVTFVVGDNTINNSSTVRVNSGESVVVKFKKVNTIQENENTVTKTFLKWVVSSNGQNMARFSETDEDQYHILTINALNGDVTLSAKYLTNNEVSTKYYAQNVYVGVDNTLQTPIILKTEELPTDTAKLSAINQYDVWYEGEVRKTLKDLLGQENLNNYDYLKQIVYDYSDPSNPVMMDLQDDNHHPMEDTHYFNKSNKNILVVFYYKQKLPTGYSELAKEGTNDFAIKSLQDEDIFAIKTGTKFKLIAPASLDDGSVFKYWIGLNANETTELVQFDNIKSNETEAQVNKDGRYVISAIYGRADAKVTKITRTNVYGDTYVNEGISYRLGSVDNIGSILPDFESYNGVSYVVSELSIETPNGIVLKKYKTSDLEIDGSNTGVTNMFKDNTPIPNGYDELVYKKTFVKAIGIDQQSALAKVQSIQKISADFDGSNISSINPDINYLEASAEDINKVSNTIDNNSSVTKYFDINMVAVDANNNKAYVTDFSDDIEVSLTLSDSELEKISNKDDVKLVRVHNGQTKIISATLNGNELKFKSNQFSTYALVYSNYVPPVNPGVISNSTISKKPVVNTSAK